MMGEALLEEEDDGISCPLSNFERPASASRKEGFQDLDGPSGKLKEAHLSSRIFGPSGIVGHKLLGSSLGSGLTHSALKRQN